MNKLETITDPAYVPTDGLSCLYPLPCVRLTDCLDDILRARIKTMGVSEHRFRLKTGKPDRREGFGQCIVIKFQNAL